MEKTNKQTNKKTNLRVHLLSSSSPPDESSPTEGDCMEFINNISYVDRLREMVSFELGKETERDVFSSCHAREDM